MADNYLNNTGLTYYHNRIKTIFASQTAFDTLEDKVDEIIAEGGEPNVIEVVKVNGTALTPDAQKAVDVTVPTNNNQLTNGAGYQTATDVDGLIDTALANGNDPYTTTSDAQGLIDDALADITGIDFEVVQTLPASGEKGVIYLVSNSGTGTNTYDEYIWLTPTGGTAHWEKIGSTDVDLSGYWAKAELTAITTAQIDSLFS